MSDSNKCTKCFKVYLRAIGETLGLCPDCSKKTKTRKCLKCGKDFESAGKANRICATCNRENTKKDTPFRRVGPTLTTARGGIGGGD